MKLSRKLKNPHIDPFQLPIENKYDKRQPLDLAPFGNKFFNYYALMAFSRVEEQEYTRKVQFTLSQNVCIFVRCLKLSTSIEYLVFVHVKVVFYVHFQTEYE